MITLFQIWQSFQAYVNTFQGSWYRPNTDFQPAVNDISKEMWEEWTGQAEKSQEIKDHLQPFLKPRNLIVKQLKGSYGLLETPSDYGRFSSARIIVSGSECIPCKDVDNGKCNNGAFKDQEEIDDQYYDSLKETIIELIDNQKWAACLGHLTKKPTLERPKMTEYKNGWYVAPRKISVIVLDYYTRPQEGTFVYTTAPGDTNTGAGDYLIYDSANSTSLEWPETVINEFVIRLGIRFGIYTRDQFIAAASSQQKAA